MSAFGKDDLSKMLSTEAGDLTSLRHTVDSSELTFEDGEDASEKIGHKNKVDVTRRVRRWRRGEGEEEEEEESEGSGEEGEEEEERKAALEGARARGVTTATSRTSPSPSSRRRREAESDSDSSSDEEASAKRVGRSRISASVVNKPAPPPPPSTAPSSSASKKNKIVGDSSSDSDSSEDEEEQVAKRGRIKARVMAQARERQRVEEEGKTKEKEKGKGKGKEKGGKEADTSAASDGDGSGDGSGSSSGSSSSDSDSDESSSEEEDLAPPPLLKFIPKSQRGTVATQEKLDAEYYADEEKKAGAKKLRAIETQIAVAEEVQREKEGAVTDVSNDQQDLAFIPDDSDDPADESAYAAWEEREIMRLVAELMLSGGGKTARKVKEEAERRRRMTDGERVEEDSSLLEKVRKQKDEKRAAAGAERDGKKVNMRYQHQGAFYMDADTLSAAGPGDVRTKNYHRLATADAFDVSKMPEVMQVRNFGRSGQSKHTSNRDQDTTERGPGRGEDYGGGKRKR